MTKFPPSPLTPYVKTSAYIRTSHQLAERCTTKCGYYLELIYTWEQEMNETVLITNPFKTILYSGDTILPL